MKRVFIIHGFEGLPNGGWRPWLMGKLSKDKIYACALPMPNPYDPKKDEWVKAIADAVGEPTEEIFLVGHSLGVPAILRYLESIPKNKKIGGAVLVSGPYKPIILPSNPNIYKIEHFINYPFDFDKIKDTCSRFTVIHGDNDDVVPFSHAEYFSENLKCNIYSVKNGKHLSGGAGWFELPEALQAVLKVLNS
jgi:uncharacterized protein